MLGGAMLWGQVIGTFCGVIAAFNPELSAFHRTMDELNRFMSREQLPSEMQRRLREYFHQSQHIRLAEQQRTLLTAMPPSLKGEVSWQTNKRWLSQIWFLRGTSTQFMLELAMALHAMVFAPGDMAPRGYLYIVQKGIALYRARLIIKGRVWGEDMVVANPRLRHPALARAMNYLAVNYINRTELLAVAEKYPHILWKIRRGAAFMALRREIVLRARFMTSGGSSPSSQLQTLAAEARRRSALTQAARQPLRTSLVDPAFDAGGGSYRVVAAPTEDVSSLTSRGERGGDAGSSVEFREEVFRELQRMRTSIEEREARRSNELARAVREIQESQTQQIAELAKALQKTLQTSTGGARKPPPQFSRSNSTRTMEDVAQDGQRSGGDKFAPIRVRRKKGQASGGTLPVAPPASDSGPLQQPPAPPTPDGELRPSDTPPSEGAPLETRWVDALTDGSLAHSMSGEGEPTELDA